MSPQPWQTSSTSSGPSRQSRTCKCTGACCHSWPFGPFFKRLSVRGISCTQSACGGQRDCRVALSCLTWVLGADRL